MAFVVKMLRQTSSAKTLDQKKFHINMCAEKIAI